MISLEQEFEAACALGCWRRGVMMQRPLWSWRAQRRYLETRIAGRLAERQRALGMPLPPTNGMRHCKDGRARLRLVADGGALVQRQS